MRPIRYGAVNSRAPPHIPWPCGRRLPPGLGPAPTRPLALAARAAECEDHALRPGSGAARRETDEIETLGRCRPRAGSRRLPPNAPEGHGSDARVSGRGAGGQARLLGCLRSGTRSAGGAGRRCARQRQGGARERRREGAPRSAGRHHHGPDLPGRGRVSQGRRLHTAQRRSRSGRVQAGTRNRPRRPSPDRRPPGPTATAGRARCRRT